MGERGRLRLQRPAPLCAALCEELAEPAALCSPGRDEILILGGGHVRYGSVFPTIPPGWFRCRPSGRPTVSDSLVLEQQPLTTPQNRSTKVALSGDTSPFGDLSRIKGRCSGRGLLEGWGDTRGRPSHSSTALGPSDRAGSLAEARTSGRESLPRRLGH